MNSHASTSRYILTALAIILVITAFILVALNAMNLTPSFSSPLGGNSEQSYKEGFLAARAMYAPLLPELSDTESLSLSATVLSNNGTSLRVRATSLDTDEIVDGVSLDRTVLITSATKIRELQPKDPATLDAEIAAFNAQSNPDAESPSPDVERIVPLSEVKEGMRIRIQSASAVRLLPTIDATVVTVLK
ncbi:hypothetical protein KBC59_02785 [Patescibacteria group bacterium]|nr:hypothetical protein [Patescibacteria group bacterium]